MTLRDHCTEEQLEAHRVLDGVRAGLSMHTWTVTWALLVLGDLVG